jgi:hypothetical protein
MKFNLLMLLFLLPITLSAQVLKVNATIVDPGSLFSTYDFTEDIGMLKPAAKLQGAGKILTDITIYSQESSWPEGLNSLDSRLANREEFFKYTVYKIVSTADYCILVVPAAENRNLDAKFKPTRDIYFIMETVGVDFEGNIAVRTVETEEVYGEDTYAEGDYGIEEEGENVEAQVYITAPGDLFSTFDLNGDENAHEVMVGSEILTEEEFSYLASMSTENSWPSGISTLDSRLAAAEQIKEYVTYFVATFGPAGDDYVLVWVPLYGNEHMPQDMQPTSEEGFYMILKSSGVAYE